MNKKRTLEVKNSIWGNGGSKMTPKNGHYVSMIKKNNQFVARYTCVKEKSWRYFL